MANAMSRLHNALETWSFKYNCYEAVHPWTPFCSYSALDLGLTVFGEAIKLYTPLYLFSQVSQRKFDLDSFKSTSQSILRSTTFISANAFFALLFFCSSQYVTGKFYYYAVAYIPGFLASSMAVLIEKPNRRSSLAFYVANVASEALFRISVARGYVRPVNNGQVYLFSLSIATIMLLAKKHGFEDDPLSTAIKLVVGPEEANKRSRRRHPAKDVDLSRLGEKSESLKRNEDFVADGRASLPECISNQPKEKHQQVDVESHKQEQHVEDLNASATSCRLPSEPTNLFDRLKRTLHTVRYLFVARHRLCPHRQTSSCFYYVSRASIRALLIGYGAQLGLKLTTKIPKLMLNPKQEPSQLLRELLFDTSSMGMGLFLATFTGLYKATNCSLRWSLDTSKPVNCFISGLVAGPSLMFYPSPTVALYVLWKCLETLFHEAVRLEIIRNKDVFIVVLYGLATAQLFYSAMMDPRYMKKSYMAFLDRISHHRLHMVNRSVLDVFGTEASAGYEDFFPDLHPKFMSRAFLGSIWVWMIEQKFVAKQLIIN